MLGLYSTLQWSIKKRAGKLSVGWGLIGITNHEDYAHGLCPQIMPTDYAHRLCPQIMPTGYAHRLCPRIMPTDYAHGLCPRIVPTDYAHRLYPRIMPTGYAHGLCPQIIPGAPWPLILTVCEIPLIPLSTQSAPLL
ncbi:unnamed protein product [Discosporangium mesarthrocarpum]